MKLMPLKQINPMLKQLRVSLATRELLPVAALLFLLIGLGLFQFGLRPLLAEKDRLTRVAAAREQGLHEVRQLALEYQTLQRTNEHRWQPPSGQTGKMTLFGFLEQQAGHVGIKPHIVYMKPSQTGRDEHSYPVSVVEMKLQGLDLAQITRFLNLIEKAGAFDDTLIVRRFALTRSTGATPTLELILRVESLTS